MMDVVYVLYMQEAHEHDDFVVAVFSTFESAKSSISDVEWEDDVGLIGDYSFTRKLNESGHHDSYYIHPYTLDPDDLELG